MSNDTRPASFDARLLAYQPAMRALAFRLSRNAEERENLLADTFVVCLENWQKFREDGGFYNWIRWTMRGVFSAMIKKRRVGLVEDPEGRHINRLVQLPDQIDAIELRETFAQLDNRDGRALLRTVMGDTLSEIADDIGVSTQRVYQMSSKARAMLQAAA